jgi:hypothetical protein
MKHRDVFQRMLIKETLFLLYRPARERRPVAVLLTGCS